MGIVIVGFSSILTGLNFIATVAPHARAGADVVALPIFVWTIYATSFIFRFSAVPVLAMALILVIIERAARHRHFRPEPRRRSGAVPALLLVLLAPGRVHHDPARHGHRQRGDSRASHARRCSATRRGLSRAFGIAVLGVLVWGHHMFVAGISHVCGHGLLGADVPGGDAVGDQGLQLDGDAVQGLDLASKRRCFMRWGSCACSRSAD